MHCPPEHRNLRIRIEVKLGEVARKNIVMLGKTIVLVKVMEMVVEAKLKLYELKGMEELGL